MRVTEARFLTTLAVIGLCTLAVSRGWNIVRFSSVNADVVSHGQPVEVLRAWASAPGLTVRAREASLTRVRDPSDLDAARRRSEDLVGLLSVRPLSSMMWLSLAGMRLVTGQPLDKVLGPLGLSSLTGANEGEVMLQRAVFGMLQWETLPADARKRMLADLAGAVLGGVVPEHMRTASRNILAVKTADIRYEIAGLLRAEGLSSAELARLGM